MAATRPASPKDDVVNDELTAQTTEVRVTGTGMTPAHLLDRTNAPAPFDNADFQPPAPTIADAAASPPQILDYTWKEKLVRQVSEWLHLFVEDGPAVELRALNVQMASGARMTISGFYSPDAMEAMAAQALELSADSEGVYFTLNPLDPSLLARRYNRVEPAKDTATDADVIRRRWLLVDADPVRKAGISATDEEKHTAWELARLAYFWLQGLGWPDPVLADSGNGYHLLYRVDLPADDHGLVKSVLETLAKSIDEAAVKIDTKVFNPSRIVKLYGTVARKGDSIGNRPHRRTGVLAVPETVRVVSREQLETLAGMAGTPAVGAETPPPTSQLAAAERTDRMNRARRYLMHVPPAISGESGHNQTRFQQLRSHY